MHKKNKLFKSIWLIPLILLTITFGCEDRDGITFPSESTPPVVNSTDPTNFATGVAINKNITVQFSEAIDASTLSTATFIVKQGTTTVPGVVLASRTTAIFIPSDNLSPNTIFTATITTGIKDLAHNAMAANYVWSFTSGATADITSPLVNFTDPLNAATNVIMNKIITVTFSKAMDASTMATAFTLMQGTTSIPGAVTYSGTTASFNPSNNLSPNTTYTGTVSTAAKDIAGNALSSNYVWNFTTGTTQDITAPTVILTDPLNLATNVALTKEISATFNEAIDPSTMTTATFTLMLSKTFISGTVSYSGSTAVFTPLTNLLPNSTYTATITKSVKDLAGNAMSSNHVWTFTTSAMPNIVTLVSSPAEGGSTSGGGSFTTGSSVTVTASPNTGYAFSNWTENGIIVSTNSSYQFTIAQDRTLIANFIVATTQYSITLSADPLAGGTTSGGGSFDLGSSVTVIAIPKAGYTFSNWSENGITVSTSANYQFTITKNRTLVANFMEPNVKYSITLSSDPLIGGTTSGSGSFDSGSSVIVIAIPKAGYTFSNWSENGIT
ncbi:MAG: Ig-like domain-containing protein, partial [Melioribacteraceae bacterium]|nr:Ig-like domain-containing protein [Melioribacteraceae bacterium]